MKIGADNARYKKIIRGKIRDNLKKYISSDQLVGQQGGKKVSIPIPRITTPKFVFGDKQTGGVGQGKGNVGDQISPGESQPGEGKAGDEAGEHMLEVEVEMDELLDILGEELQLPNIQPKGDDNITQESSKYTGIQRVGSESLKHFKRTYKEALKRTIATGTYDPSNPKIIPIKSDGRYRSAKQIEKPEAKAVIIYMMDVSGSMGQEQKDIVRMESFWLDAWLNKQYQGLETRFIIHDAVAKEVDRHTFFNTRESGGTMISSAYTLCSGIIKADYPVSSWNIYVLHFSDGDNWSEEDNNKTIGIIQNDLLPVCNMIGYGQVESAGGSGEFGPFLQESLPNEERIIVSKIENKEGIMESIKTFLGKGY